MSFSLILPTLNENGHIINLIESISEIFNKKKIIFEIIIVDDNSTDGTVQNIKENKHRFNFLEIITRINIKKNLAESINEGIKKAKYENIIWMDADFQHPPIYINEFIEKIKNHEVVIASRFLKDSERYFKKKEFKKDINENQSFFFNKLCRLFLFKDITDYTSGFICIKKNLFNSFKLHGFYGDYFVSLIIFLKSKNVKILEIPFTDDIRASGSSKTIVNINFKYIYTCLRYFLTLIIAAIRIKVKK
jgi:dolichol-phosphate mannosyltransferase